MLSNNINCPFIGVLTGNHSTNQLKELKIGKALIINSVSDLNSNMIFYLI
jgi:phosphoglycolate phosphatase-like HAD superfamily hydrolase